MFSVNQCFKINILVICSWQLATVSTAEGISPKSEGINPGYQELLLEAIKFNNPFHTLVLLFDEELDQSKISVELIQELHELNFIITCVNIGKTETTSLIKTFGTYKQSDVLEALLRRLYSSRGRVGVGAGIRSRYFFVVWVANPTILYSSRQQPTSHPGWTHFDRVYVVYPENGIAARHQEDLLDMELWKHIPRVVFFQQSSRSSNLVNAFYVDSIIGTKEQHFQNVNVWVQNEKRFYKHPRNVVLSRKRFSTLDGATLVVGNVWKDPFLIWGNKLHPYMDGLDWRLCKLVERRLNFTSQLVNHEKIGRFENGNWTGLLGALSTGAVSFAFGGLPVTPERLHAFGFSTTYYTDSYAFISPQNVVKPKLLDIFQQPFQEQVWIGLGITGGSIIATMFVLANIEKWILKSRGQSIGKEDKWFTRFDNNVAFFTTQIFQKPYHHSPKSNALKFIFYGVSLGINIMGIMFVTSMIANMSAPAQQASVDKMEEILPSSITLDIRDYDGELNTYLEREKPDLWKSANLVNWFESCTSIRSVSEGTRIYIDSRARLSFMASYEYGKKKIFSFHLASEDVLEGVNLAWGMRKNWPFHRAINNVIVRAVESGIVQYWMSNFKRGKFAWDGNSEALLVAGEPFLIDWNTVVRKIPPRKGKDGQYKYEPISSKQLKGVVLMYETGCLVSVLVFLLEHVACTIFVLIEMLTWLGKEIYQAFLKAATRNINQIRSTKNLVKERLKMERRKRIKGKWAAKYLYRNKSSDTKSSPKTENEHPEITALTEIRNRQGQQSNTSLYSFESPFSYLK